MRLLLWMFIDDKKISYNQIFDEDSNNFGVAHDVIST